jgi:hypothetical protein
MDLTPYLETLRADLTAAAAPGGPDTLRAAELLGNAIEPSARLALLEALSDAAAEITTRLRDATVELRLRGGEAELVVNHTEYLTEEPAPAAPAPGPFADPGGDLTRLTLRMPESLKTHVEQTAAREGISVNAWLVRAVAAAVHGQPPASSPPSPPAGPGLRTGRRITGFAQA